MIYQNFYLKFRRTRIIGVSNIFSDLIDDEVVGYEETVKMKLPKDYKYFLPKVTIHVD